MAKKKKEKYIKERKSRSTGLVTYQVSFAYLDEESNETTYNKSFSEKEYGSAALAFEAAKRHRDEMRHRLNTEGIEKPKAEYSVDDVYSLSKKLFPQSVETFRKHDVQYNAYIKPIYGNKSIADVKASDIMLCLNALIEDKTDDTIRRVFGIWKRIISAALIEDIIFKDPTIKVKLPKSEVPAIHRNVNTTLETIQSVQDAIMKYARGSDRYQFNAKRLCYAIRLMYYTGMRPSECFALTRSDLDFESLTISVNKAVGSTKSKRLTVKRTKTESSVREIPITSEIESLLDEILDFQNNEYLFADYDGNLPDMRIIGKTINYVCQKEGIDFTLYRLRHKFSTDMITSKEVDIRTAMELMGHTAKSMTLDYARSNEKLKREALKNRKLS
ncbi:tyrosine-type recombinase/integrase [Holdemania massiliensis]|uniref:tyrosine-type recombinase/integrase n=1 Tax=Holdemania massiliensis TaxID=1468449 RepID=UPI00351F97FB